MHSARPRPFCHYPNKSRRYYGHALHHKRRRSSYTQDFRRLVVSFDLSEYVDVKHRLNLALHKHPDLRIVEDAPELITIGERVYIQCAVTVFRSADDLLPGRAYCWEVWPGRTPFTKESEQQNGATSALGRCLGYMGFGIDTGIASANEVRTAQANNHPATERTAPARATAAPASPTPPGSPPSCWQDPRSA